MNTSLHQQQKKRRNPQGFTLIEIVIAMAIISLLTGTILFMSHSLLGLTNALQSEQSKVLIQNNMESFINTSVSSAMNTGSLEAAVIQDAYQEVTLRESDLYFPYKGEDTIAHLSVFKTTPQPDGLLGVELQHFLETESLDPQPDYEIVLLDGLISAEWQFYYHATREWITQWEESQGKPRLIKLIYQREEDEFTSTILIAINNIQN
ncbi:prepilin-type N-terminal cleavage/methylation domain-containing protein [Akkermansiaceae bacterium]|nr:prepilin-type N-terminal cleavage/methylation domain-containing protein [Akkermansiaceae bacterium]